MEHKETTVHKHFQQKLSSLGVRWEKDNKREGNKEEDLKKKKIKNLIKLFSLLPSLLLSSYTRRRQFLLKALVY